MGNARIAVKKYSIGLHWLQESHIYELVTIKEMGKIKTELLTK